MLFLTAVCHQSFNDAREMNMVDAMELQAAFARFMDSIFGKNLSPDNVKNILKKIPPPEEWI